MNVIEVSRVYLMVSVLEEALEYAGSTNAVFPFTSEDIRQVPGAVLYNYAFLVLLVCIFCDTSLQRLEIVRV